MIQRLILYLSVGFSASGVERLAAAELPCGGLGRQLAATRCAAVPACCPPDACRKPWPCIPCPPQSSGTDDYCRKPLPCLPCFALPGLSNDYCRKPWPDFCWPQNPSVYRCAPANTHPAVPSAAPAVTPPPSGPLAPDRGA